MTVKALVAAFEPFGGDDINASLEALRRLPDKIGAIEIYKLQLPTSFSRSMPVLEKAVTDFNPDLVLCLGQAETRSVLSLERIAVNVQDARIPDNDGARPEDQPVREGGPVAYLATLPLRKALAALRAQGIVAEISDSAGTFVCNAVFYGLMDHLAREGRKIPAGFLHVPALETQSVDTLAKGVCVVLETSA